MADSILFWNAVALEANRVSHSDPDKKEQTGPTLSSRALAIIHLAMYDAYAGVANNAVAFPPYLSPLPSSPGTSHRDAVAGAAFTTLSGLFKTQREFFDAQLSCFDTSNPSYKFGVKVGDALLRKRANDPDARDCGYTVSPARYRHRVDPDNPGQGFHAPFYGAQSQGFAITKRWKLAKPPTGDAEYDEALKQVLAEGIKPELMGTLQGNFFNNRRTPEQTTVGVYWAYDGANGLGTPPRQYNQIIRLIAMKRSPGSSTVPNTEGENARLFAFVNAAMGDAGTLAWEQKYCHDFWRPVVGIREHGISFGPAPETKPGNTIPGDADPFWLPLGAPSTNTMMKNFTPPFPAYPSGHATFGAAAFHITRLFYGKGFATGGTPVIPNGKPIIKGGNLVPDDLFDGLGFVSDELNGGNRDNQGTVRPRHVRDFDKVNTKPGESGGLGKMIIENATSRIYLGVHWIFDAFKMKNNKPDFSIDGLKIGGVPLGLKIAEDIFKAGGGIAPTMTPEGTAAPPITTPPPNSPMPTIPKQPASVGDCAGAGKKAAKERERVKGDYLSGISPR